MKRSQLKNIINKSKTISNKQEVGNPFDEFKKSLPIEVDDNYRLEAAWKAYGSPKDYKQAIWEGLIQPIDENTYKLPSIGYNEETDEYEYLNKGEDNETVAKDIRVWDNDVIPLVQELKLGGYVRTFNKEKDCWTYSKNSQKREQPIETDEQQVIEEFKKGGKKENNLIIPSFLVLDKNGNYISKYFEDDKNAEDRNWYFSKEAKNFRKHYRLDDLDWDDENRETRFFRYIPKKEYNKLYFQKYPIESIEGIGESMTDVPFEDAIYTDKGIAYKSDEEFASDGQPFYITDDGERYTKYEEGKSPQTFKQGGQMNVIPEGALHARKNNMEGAGEDFTAKGIPVVDNNGEQQAEIEKEEWTMTKELTDDVEKWYKEYYKEDTSQKDKDELAIKCGKRITKELLHNTDDRANLIAKMLEEEEEE